MISVDYFQDFTERARIRLEQHQCHNVELVTGDGCQGWLEKAPYDVVVMTGAIDAVTETQRLQLLPHGKLLVILGREPVMKALLYVLEQDGSFTETLLFSTCIPPLIDKLKPREFVFEGQG